MTEESVTQYTVARLLRNHPLSRFTIIPVASQRRHENMLKARVALLFFLVCSCSAFAETIDSADAALMRGEYELAAQTLTSLAEDGDPMAMVRLASLYHRGEGVERNIEKAVDLYLSAAELGNAEAQFNLGNMYLLGEGVDEDESWALTFYRLAAKQGHPLAAANLNEMIRSGVGTDPSQNVATLAATSTSSESDSSNQAPAYSDTLPTNSETQLSSDSGPDNHAAKDVPATLDHSSAISEEDATEDRGALEDLAQESQSTARSLDETVDSAVVAALEPEPDSEPEIVSTQTIVLEPIQPAQTIEGDDARLGEDPATPPTAAQPTVKEEPLVNIEPLEPVREIPTYSSDEVQAIKIAEEHGITVNIDGAGPSAEPASTELSDGSPQLYADQVLRFEQAQRMLVDGQPDDAIVLLEELAGEGYADAAVKLADRAGGGDDAPQDASEELKWRLRAAELGDSEAQFQLAERYMTGDAVDPDDAMAITYYRDAARGGHQLAERKLRTIYADAGLPFPDFARSRTPILIYPKDLDGVASAEQSADTDNDYVIDSATSASDEQSQTLVVPGENRTKGEESSYEKVNTH